MRRYEPGDILGVQPQNSAAAADGFIQMYAKVASGDGRSGSASLVCRMGWDGDQLVHLGTHACSPSLLQ
jgi:hypothetical protein